MLNPKHKLAHKPQMLTIRQINEGSSQKEDTKFFLCHCRLQHLTWLACCPVHKFFGMPNSVYIYIYISLLHASLICTSELLLSSGLL